MLQKFGSDLAGTELPNNVQCTKDLLMEHTDNHNSLKVAYTVAKFRAKIYLQSIDQFVFSP